MTAVCMIRTDEELLRRRLTDRKAMGTASWQILY